MQGGRLDVRIDIRRATTTANAFNEPIETWATLATVWAEAKPVLDSERLQAGQTIAQRQYRFTIRWSSVVADVNPRDRILYDGREYDIEGVKDLERNRWREITATARAE